MAYTLNRSDGTILITLNDGAVNSAAIPLTLFGKAYKDWGEATNENFIHLLENFANSTPPTPNPMNGQLWYNTTTANINVWNGSIWQALTTLPAGIGIFGATVSGGTTVGFTQGNDLIGLYSTVSANATELPTSGVNPQVKFINGIGAGLNLSVSNNRIYGQGGLLLGYNQGEEVIYITTTDRVGINNDNPSTTLDVAGDTTLRGNVRIDNPVGGATPYYLPISAGLAGQALISNGIGNTIRWSTVDRITGNTNTNQVVASANPNVGITFTTNSIERMRVATNGNVGIGVINTGVNGLEVGRSGATSIRIRNTSLNSSLTLTNTTGNISTITHTNAGEAIIDLNPIPTDNSSQGLVRIGRNTDTSGMNGLVVTTGNSPNAQHSLVNNANSYVVANNGNFGIARINPATRLDVSGNSTFRGSITVDNSIAVTNQYILPLSAGTNGQIIQATSSAQTKWAAPPPAPVLTQYYESPNTASGELFNAGFLHNLGGVPRQVQLSFLCVVANGGYLPGDEVTPHGWQTEFDQFNAVSIWWNASQVGASRNRTVRAATKLGATDGDNFAVLSNSNWRYKFRAMR